MGNAFDPLSSVDVFDGVAMGGDTGNLFKTAAAANAQPSYIIPKWDLSIAQNAAEAAQPVNTKDTGGNFTDFWQGIAKTVVGYTIAKDAAKSGMTTTGGQVQQGSMNGATQNTPTSQVQARGISPAVLMLAGALGLGYLIARKG